MININKSFYYKYILPSLLVTGISISGLYMYGTFLVNNAYQEKRYADVMRYTQLFGYVSSHAVDTTIKSLLEKRIDFISKREYIFDPLQKPLVLSYYKLNEKIGIGTNTRMQRFAQSMYNERLNKKYETMYKMHLPFVYYELSSLLNHHVRIRNQKQYQTSCYFYPLKKYTKEYLNNMKRSVFCVQELKDENSTQMLQKCTAKYNPIINGQLGISSQINIYNIDENCWAEIQKELLTGINEVDQLLDNSKLPPSIRKELYTELESFATTLYQGIEALESKYSLKNNSNEEIKNKASLIIKKYNDYASQK